jgi:spermidine/putrescine-binding protein
VAGGVTGGVAGYLGGRAAERTSTGTAPRDAAAGAVAGPRRRERLLNIYNWSDYIDDKTIPLFHRSSAACRHVTLLDLL